MNILFFLTPKKDVAYINEDDTLRQALEKMEYHQYSAIPIISREGHYVGTLTEGDLLWGIKNQYNLDLKVAERVPVTAIHRRQDNSPVLAGADMEDLIGKVLNQNFVPVLDDHNCFIGIITRKDIIQYFFEKFTEEGCLGRVLDRKGQSSRRNLSAMIRRREKQMQEIGV